MEIFIEEVLHVLGKTIIAVFTSLQHNWLVLVFTIVVAVLFKTYVNAERFSEQLNKRKKVSIFSSVAVGAFTPFCACGTTAVIIGMLTTALPWGPIMAFLTSSPLMSPDGFLMVSGIIGIRFAIALTIASLVIGVVSGFITYAIERKTSFLVNQSRYTENGSVRVDSCSCEQKKEKEHSPAQKWKIQLLKDNFINLGLKQILLFFSIFVAVGYLMNYFIPASIIDFLFGANSFFAIPLAALIGLPLYLTTESALPIIQSMLASGANEGAMLTFIITGSATSAWVIAGLATFLKRRAILLYVGFVFFGGILAGYCYQMFLVLSV